MLEIKNIIEDIVFDLLDNSELVKKNEINRNQKMEIAAYVLNRIKPMYITSNKGFTNSIIKYQNDPQFLADIILQISEASKVVRRSYNVNKIMEALDLQKLYYVLPKVYGKVISSKELLPIKNVSIALYIEGILAQNLFDLWKNPTEILARDEGIFSFAPKPILASEPYEKKVFQLSLVIQKDKNRHDKSFVIECAPSLINSTEADFHENILQLEDLYVPF